MILSKRHHIHHRTKNILSYILSFFIMICSVVMLMCITLKLGLFAPGLIEENMRKSSYYEYRTDILNRTLENYLVESGLKAEMAEGIITDSMISVDTGNYISGAFSGEPVSYDTQILEASIRDNITRYLTESGITPDDKFERYMDGIVSEAAAIYKSNISFEFIDPYIDFLAKYDFMIKPVITTAIILIIICIVLLCMLHRRKYRAIRFFTYGLLSGSVVTYFTSMYMKRTFMNLLDGEGIYYNVIQGYISDAFVQGYTVALGGIMICCISLIITYLFRKSAI